MRSIGPVGLGLEFALYKSYHFVAALSLYLLPQLVGVRKRASPPPPPLPSGDDVQERRRWLSGQMPIRDGDGRVPRLDDDAPRSAFFVGEIFGCVRVLEQRRRR